MGTSGRHLELPPYAWSDPERNPIRTRFNVIQALDDWPQIQYLMIKEMDPELYARHGLNELENKRLWKGLTGEEAIAWNGGAFATALLEFHARRAAGSNLMGTRDVDLYLDYEFWIRAGVRWLFYKYEALDTPNWSEAVRAYNGDGPRARAYRERVLRRVTGSSPVYVRE